MAIMGDQFCLDTGMLVAYLRGREPSAVAVVETIRLVEDRTKRLTMTMTGLSQVNVKTTLMHVVDELSIEHIAEVLDFALFVKTRQVQQKREMQASKEVELTKTIAALQADGAGGRLLEQLLAARAEDRARER